jgi:hypothetical protein
VKWALQALKVLRVLKETLAQQALKEMWVRQALKEMLVLLVLRVKQGRRDTRGLQVLLENMET